MYRDDIANDFGYDCDPFDCTEAMFESPWAPGEPECHERSRSKPSPREIGLRGEEAAARFLERRGYTVLERNWACPFGEVDIIALGPDDDELVFVEVKTRSTEATGLPEEAVGPAKRRRYESIALAYLRDSEFTDMPILFDVIAISLADWDRALLRHHHRAFCMGE